MEKYKKIQEKKEMFIQFSPEELEELGWAEGQKLSISYNVATNSITLKPFVKVDIDLSEWDRYMLEDIINRSCETDMSCNEVIADLLSKSLESLKGLESKEQLILEEKENGNV